MFARSARSRRRGLVAPVALGTAAVLTLAACSSGGSTGTSTTGGGSPAAGSVSISLSLQNPDVQTADPATWAIVKAFEAANPDVTVQVSGKAVAEHLQDLTIAAQSDTLPDIFWVYKSTAEDMVKANRLLDLSSILKDTGVGSHLAKATEENFTAGGITYGVPYQGLLTGLWINTAILKQHNLAVPTTFDDLLNVAKTLHDAGVVTISDGANQSSFSCWSFLVWLERFGFSQKVAGLLDGSQSYNNPDFLKMYQHIAQLRDADAFASNVSTQTYQQAVDQFVNGKAAMLDAGVWASSAIQSSSIASDVTFWKGAEFSDGVGNQNIIMNVASAPLVVDHRVANDPKKLDAVTRFLKFYYSDQAQQILVDNGQPPVTDYKAQLDPSKQSALKAALDAASAPGVSSPVSQPDLLVPTAVANAMYDSIYGVIQNQLSPQQAVDLVQAALQSK